MAEIITLPMDAGKLRLAFLLAFRRWKQSPTPENAVPKHRAWLRWAEHREAA